MRVESSGSVYALHHDRTEKKNIVTGRVIDDENARNVACSMVHQVLGEVSFLWKDMFTESGG